MHLAGIMAIVLTAQLSAATGSDPKADKQTIVSCSGVVVSHTPQAIHYRYVDGGFGWSDITVIRLSAPKEWDGHLLHVQSTSLPAKHPLKNEGLTIQFKIAKLYLVQDYPRTDGKYDSYFAGDGSLEILATKPKQ